MRLIYIFESLTTIFAVNKITVKLLWLYDRYYQLVFHVFLTLTLYFLGVPFIFQAFRRIQFFCTNSQTLILSYLIFWLEMSIKIMIVQIIIYLSCHFKQKFKYLTCVLYLCLVSYKLKIYYTYSLLY